MIRVLNKSGAEKKKETFKSNGFITPVKPYKNNCIQ